MKIEKRAAALLTAGFLLATGTPNPAQTPPKPVAQWNFDEGTGTVAAAPGGNDGTLTGNARWETGLVGAHALRLSGRGSFVDVAKPLLDTSKSYTVTACIKLAREGGYRTFVSIDGAQNSGFFLQLRADTGEFALTVPPGDGTPGETAIASSDVLPDTDRWYHLAGVYDASAKTLSLYVNGKLQQTVPCRNAWRASGHTVIGRGKFGGNPVDFVDGALDDVRLYASALPAADILQIAQADLPAAMQAPVAAPPSPASLTIDAAQPGHAVSPMLYGLMTEEINYSYDGGLYGELIRNRVFLDSAEATPHWTLVQTPGASGAMTLDRTSPLSDALPVSVKLDVKTGRVGLANDGYWGFPITPNTTYRASFYAHADANFSGPFLLTLESADGTKTYAKAQSGSVTGGWKKYDVTLKTGKTTPTKDARFVISTDRPGVVNLNLISLFPPTYNNRPNGNRKDLMEKLAGMHQKFLRLPGGNYLEGDTIETRFDWKKTLGPLTQRSGHQGPWGYRSTDGMGLLEFLTWCEDLKIEPVLAVYAGYSLRGAHVEPGKDLDSYVQDALDEIEYVTGDKTTKWGAIRIKNGHPAPFPLQYVEIGNEDWFDRSGSYDGRFTQFFDALKAKYPKLQYIATADVKTRVPDVIDEHYYRSSRTFQRDVAHYDNYDRKGPKIFVGEWAAQEGRPTPDMNSALGDAAWMTGMERNSDIVILESYAPLLVNVNPGGSQWGTNLIGYDALNSYGSPSYYAQAMFACAVGDVVLPGVLTGGSQIFQSVTKDSKSGEMFVKLVNTSSFPQTVHVTLSGVSRLGASAKAVTLSSAKPRDTNASADPIKIVPATSSVKVPGPNFDYSLAPYSIVVLTLSGK